MRQIDESRLETDLDYRFDYLAGFMGFGEADVAAIHESAALLAPLVPSLVDAVYEKLFQYDATSRHFTRKQAGYEGDVPDGVGELHHTHPLIQFRKQHLGRYLAALVTRPYDGKMVAYLDMVGKMHTPKAGARDLDVPLVQMNALMGFVADALTGTIQSLGLSLDVERHMTRAFLKLLWLQNDLINRHYAVVAPGVAGVSA